MEGNNSIRFLQIQIGIWRRVAADNALRTALVKLHLWVSLDWSLASARRMEFDKLGLVKLKLLLPQTGLPFLYEYRAHNQIA